MGMTLKRSSLVAAMLMGLFAGTSNAEVLEAKIPFTFVVRGQAFPAGRYQFTTGQALLAIRGRDNGAGMFVMTVPAGGRDPKGDEPVLIFNRHEKTYRLTEIWNSDIRGSSLVTSGHHKSVPPVVSSTDRILITAAAAAETR